jgi:hypothetical protein
MYFVFICENRKMKAVDIVLRISGRGMRENEGRGKSNQDIL